MRYLLFGGAGFIGRSLSKALQKQGDWCLLSDNLAVVPAEGSRTHECDINEKTHVWSALSGVEDEFIICWFAAKQGYNASRREFGQTNVMASYQLFDAIEAMPRPDRVTGILLASSEAIYFPCLDAREDDEKRPPSTYGLSKWQQEEAFWHFCSERRIPLVTMRYSIVLGAGQSLQSTESGIMRNWWRAFQEKKAPQVYGDGLHLRDFVHISDVTSANLAALQEIRNGGSSSYNIGGPVAEVSRVAGVFHRYTGCEQPVVLNKDMRPGGEYSMTMNCDRAKRFLGWEPQVGLEDMIADFCDAELAKIGRSK